MDSFLVLDFQEESFIFDPMGTIYSCVEMLQCPTLSSISQRAIKKVGISDAGEYAMQFSGTTWRLT